MHIPDGYLSPSTCAVLYAAAAPFWYVALQRVKRLLSTRLVPLLSVFAAFSFVIMMFNLPLPGGTTGHAAGMAIATVVLGPWASMLAVSVALLIQAVFFGDGGITAIGANCFNIAIVGSLVAHWVYRAIAGQSEPTARRRVVAGALAGYAAINAAALITAIEFGIQPELFKDAAGVPLYAPYPLSIAIPAMMLGHLTIAGLAEAVVTGGVIAYLQRTDPSLLKLHTLAPSAGVAAPAPRQGGWRSTTRLWVGMALLMILTPLGLLAAGTAWGEWGPDEFASPEGRQEIGQVSGNVLPPEQTPQGLEQLSSFWTSPIPDYAPPFLTSPELGYIMSALFGTGLVILACLAVGWLARLLRGRGDADRPIEPEAGAA
ncbi:MAG TPA: cobalt transporter CbiM [Roseiflexaceae bacterium]|nr:cobalt transporter CbiM [Roseiflexaceae bacterium]